MQADLHSNTDAAFNNLEGEHVLQWAYRLVPDVFHVLKLCLIEMTQTEASPLI